MRRKRDRYKRFATSEELSDILLYLRSMMRKILSPLSLINIQQPESVEGEQESFEERRRKAEDEEGAEEKAF